MIKHKNILTNLKKNNIILDYAPTGSNYICTPPVKDTDIDYVVYTGDLEWTLDKLTSIGWVQGDTKNYSELVDDFVSMRFDVINLIVTGDFSFYDKWVKATAVAKKLNLLKKQDRIILFDFVLYDTLPE